MRCTGSECATPCCEMKLAIFPSLSQVMSWMVARRSGRSPNRCKGTTGKTWSMAHESGSDWKSEKLQKYFSGSILVTARSSSGACFMFETMSLTSRATLQNSFSTSARVRRSISPRLNRSRASSRI